LKDAGLALFPLALAPAHLKESKEKDLSVSVRRATKIACPTKKSSKENNGPPFFIFHFYSVLHVVRAEEE